MRPAPVSSLSDHRSRLASLCCFTASARTRSFCLTAKMNHTASAFSGSVSTTLGMHWCCCLGALARADCDARVPQREDDANGHQHRPRQAGCPGYLLWKVHKGWRIPSADHMSGAPRSVCQSAQLDVRPRGCCCCLTAGAQCAAVQGVGEAERRNVIPVWKSCHKGWYDPLASACRLECRVLMSTFGGRAWPDY